MINEANEQDIYRYYDENTGVFYIWHNNTWVPLNPPKKTDGFDKFDKDELERQDKKREEQIKKELDEYDPEAEDAEERLKEIGDLLDDEALTQELFDETESAVRADKQTRKKEKKEAEKNIKKYVTTEGIKEFTLDINRLIKKEVSNLTKKDWGRINKKYEGSGLYKPGKITKKNPKIPRIQVYYDQSGSWTEDDIKVGNLAMATLATYEQKKKLKIEVYYFSNHIHTSASAARRERGTGAGFELIQKIAADRPENVVIMTDDDFDSWDQIAQAGKVTVPGGAFLLFRNGEVSTRLVDRVHGTKLTKIYSF